MGNQKYDYAALERLFIQTDPSVSIRAFAKQHDVPWSAMNVQANKKDANGLTWREKRDRFHAQATQRAVAVAGDKIAEKIAAIRSDALDVIHAAVLKMGFDMQDRTYETLDNRGNLVKVTVPGQVITPDSMSKLIDRFLLLTGNATTISEERSHHVESIDFGAAGPDVARLVADIAGKRIPDGRAVAKPSLPGAGRPGPN